MRGGPMSECDDGRALEFYIDRSPEACIREATITLHSKHGTRPESTTNTAGPSNVPGPKSDSELARNTADQSDAGFDGHQTFPLPHMDIRMISPSNRSPSCYSAVGSGALNADAESGTLVSVSSGHQITDINLSSAEAFFSLGEPPPYTHSSAFTLPPRAGLHNRDPLYSQIPTVPSLQSMGPSLPGREDTNYYQSAISPTINANQWVRRLFFPITIQCGTLPQQPQAVLARANHQEYSTITANAVTALGFFTLPLMNRDLSSPHMHATNGITHYVSVKVTCYELDIPAADVTLLVLPSGTNSPRLRGKPEIWFGRNFLTAHSCSSEVRELLSQLTSPSSSTVRSTSYLGTLRTTTTAGTSAPPVSSMFPEHNNNIC